MRPILLAAVLLSALPAAAQDWCANDGLNPTEATICADAILGRLDGELGRAYGEARAVTGDDFAGAQRGWLARRDACARDVFCIERAYDERIAALREIASAPPAAPFSPPGSSVIEPPAPALPAPGDPIVEAPAPAPPPAAAAGDRPWCGASRLNAAERTICDDPLLVELDAVLAAAYGDAGARQSDGAQQDWLRRRNACGADAACIARAYVQRIAELGG